MCIYTRYLYSPVRKDGADLLAHRLYFLAHMHRALPVFVFVVVHMRNHMVVECRYTITIHKFVCIDVHVYVSYAVLALHGHDT